MRLVLHKSDLPSSVAHGRIEGCQCQRGKFFVPVHAESRATPPCHEMLGLGAVRRESLRVKPGGLHAVRSPTLQGSNRISRSVGFAHGYSRLIPPG